MENIYQKGSVNYFYPTGFMLRLSNQSQSRGRGLLKIFKGSTRGFLTLLISIKLQIRASQKSRLKYERKKNHKWVYFIAGKIWPLNYLSCFNSFFWHYHVTEVKLNVENGNAGKKNKGKPISGWQIFLFFIINISTLSRDTVWSSYKLKSNKVTWCLFCIFHLVISPDLYHLLQPH